MTRRTIDIEQQIERHERGQFSVLMEITDENVYLTKEFTYYKTNRTFPIYKSLIAILRDYEDVDVEFKTTSIYIAEEINAGAKAQGTLAKMLTEILIENNITIKAV